MKTLLRRILNIYNRYRSAKWGGLWNFVHGFKNTTIEFCGITKDNYKDFVSDVEFASMHPLNKAYSGIIDNKLYLPYLFKDYLEHIPTIYFFKDELGFLPLDKKDTKTRLTVYEFLDFIKLEQIVVLKHITMEVGRGFMLLEYKNGHYFVNKKEYNCEELISLLDSLNNYIIQAYVEQHSFFKSINSTSLNTLRFLLVYSKSANGFVLARCFQRFGCNGNVVDNLGSGNGILVYVDTERGTYRDFGVENIENKGDVFVKGIVHPNSGFIFNEKQIPLFFETKNKIIEMMNSVSFLKFVAMDVAITENGFKIIETNSYPAPDIAQYNYGFKVDPNFDYFWPNDKNI